MRHRDLRLIAPRRRPGHRSRWAAVGAAVAVSIGSGGLLTTSASIGSGERGVFVPIAPCRLFDTRPAPDNVGSRSTALGPGDTYVAIALGPSGNCNIPNDAVGLTMNVAIVNPSSASFLTVFPADVARPLAANANWSAGQPPLSNAVTTDVSADGRVAFYNLAGTVDIAADVVGYYVDHTHDDRYYTKAEADGRYPTKSQVEAGLRAPRSGATHVAVDTTGNVGNYPSVAIGADGLPVIAEWDGNNGDLRVVKCSTLGCIGTPTMTIVDGVGNVGAFPSIAVGPDGLPIIAYFDSGAGALKVAKCSDAACSNGATITTVDPSVGAGLFPSLAIGHDGLAVIAYYNFASLDLVALKCANAACTGVPTITVVDAAGDVGYTPSIAIGPDGKPVIAYRDVTNGDLKAAACSTASCAGTATITTLDASGNVGLNPSIAIPSDGRAVISYSDTTNGDLKVAACTNVVCSGTPTTTTVDAVGTVGEYSAIAIGADGLAIIAYHEGAPEYDVKFAACGNLRCDAPPSYLTRESVGTIGFDISMTIGSDGYPIAAFFESTVNNLRVLKCASLTCDP